MKLNIAISLFSLILIITPNTFGDTPPEIEVGYLCDKSADILELRLFYIQNDLEMLQKDKEDNNKFEKIHGGEVLYEGEGDNVRIKSIKNEHRFCELKKGIYKITFKTVYGNNSPYGKCGGFRSMAAEISELPLNAANEPDIYSEDKGFVLMEMRGFMESCDSKSPYLIKNIIFNSLIEKVTITEVNELSLYRPLASD
jgi:hypothetical protein